MAKVIGYFIDEGIEYEVYDTDIDSTMGEYQDREYTANITNKVFDEDTEDLNI